MSSGIEKGNPSENRLPRSGPPPDEKTAPPKTVVVTKVAARRAR
jgi:hypothetical protein